MKFARVSTPSGPVHVVERDGRWAAIADMFADPLALTGVTFPIAGTHLLAPCSPTVLVGISHNLTNNDHPLPIQAFLKSPRTVANPGDPITLRRSVGVVNMEVELAIVIGKRARDLTLENAAEVVFGYTIGNDVTNADQVEVDEKFTQVKAGDRYTPLGPWIETELPTPNEIEMRMRLDGQVRLTSSTAALPSSLAEVLVYVTEWLELGPGDVVLTGAPGTSIAVAPGDAVACEIDGLGTLSCQVA